MFEALRKKTLPGLLLERAHRTPNDVAYRAKKRGIYKERTWIEFKDQVAKCTLGLRELGLEQGDRLALMGDPREEYVICELAALALGVMTHGIYATSSQTQLQQLMEHGGACIFVAENQEYTDLISPLSKSLKELRHIIIIDTKGLSIDENPSLLTLDGLMKNGEELYTSEPDLFDELVNQIRPSDTAFVVYTPGTIGPPKGVMISHGKHLAAAYSLIDRYPTLNEAPHRTVVHLPLCSMIGKTSSLTIPLLTRIVPHYGENIEVLSETLFETAPTVLFTVPVYLKKFSSNIFVGIENSSPLKKLIYRGAIRLSRRRLKGLWEGKKNAFLTLPYLFFRFVVFKRILNKIGLNKLKIALSSDSSLPVGVMTLWQNMGVNVCEFYTQTETGGGLISAQNSPFPRPGNVGVAARGCEVVTSDEGEILIRSNDLLEGYWKDPELTESAIDGDGWLHTGDLGAWTADGNLELLGRIKDLAISQDGAAISPNRIEKVLKSSHYITEVVVFKPEEKHLSALIEVDFESVSTWARSHDVPYGEYLNLVERPEIIKLLGDEVENAGRELEPQEKVKYFCLLPHPLNATENSSPLTPTKKVKREMISSRFGELLESMNKIK
jgi:long-chain acyl-CoA synthetase